MSEQWRPVPGWEGRYAVSDHGRVKSLARVEPRVHGRPLRLREKILRGSLTSDGHRAVALCRDNRRITIKVHRLVLLAFVGPQPPGMEACHYDGDPDNNTLTNLRWDTRSGNFYDRVRHGTHHQARKTHCANGHAYDALNTYISPDGGRHCRICRLEAKRRYNARKVAA